MHKTDQWAGGSTGILVFRGKVNHCVPVPFLTNVEATAKQIILAGRPVYVLAA
jgi:hypothetical protein